MVDEDKKKRNYDYTAANRMRNRDARIKEAGLANLKVVMHRDDAEAIRAYARQLYEARGFKFD